MKISKVYAISYTIMIMTKQYQHQDCEENITTLDILIDINLSALYLANFVCGIVALRNSSLVVVFLLY